MSDKRPIAADLERLFQSGLDCLVTRADPARALEIFRIAALAGHAECQHYVGMLLRSGQGGETDPEQGVIWLRRAAQQGHTEAQFDMGAAYKLGQGVRKNRVLAMAWFLVAALSGDSDAEIHAALLADQLTCSQVRRAVRMAARWKRQVDARKAGKASSYRKGVDKLQHRAQQVTKGIGSTATALPTAVEPLQHNKPNWGPDLAPPRIGEP